MPRQLLMFCGPAVAVIALTFAAAARADDKADLDSALAGGDALRVKGDYPAAARQFERALELATSVFGPDHEKTATIINNLAFLYYKTREYSKAEPLFKQSLKIREAKLGPDHPDVAQSLNNLGTVYLDMGQFQQAEPLLQRGLKVQEAKLGPDHLEVAWSLNNLARLYDDTGQYAKAEPLFQRSLKIYEATRGPDSLDVAACSDHLVGLYRVTGQYAKAESLFQRSLKIYEATLGPDHPRVANSLNNLGALYFDMEEYAKAEPLFQRSLKIGQSTLGPENSGVAKSLNNLASIYEATGQFAKAEPLYQHSLKIYEAIQGPDSLDVAASLHQLAGLYQATGQYAQAESDYQQSLKIQEAKLGPDQPVVAQSLNSLGTLYYAMGQYAKAEPLFQRSLKIREAKLGPDHPNVATSLFNLAAVYHKVGQYAKAEPLLQRSLKIREAKFGPDHPAVAGNLICLAGLYHATGQYAKALPLYQRGLKIYEAKLGPDHPEVARSLNNLAGLYFDMKQYAKAEPLFRRSLEIREATLGAEHPDVAESLHNLATLYNAMKQYDKAEPLFQQSLKISESGLGPNHPAVASSLHNLAILYEFTRQYAKAEPLFQRCLNIQEASLGPDDPAVAFTLNNLAGLYDDMGQWTAAAREIDHARRIVRRHVARTLPILAEQEQLTFLQNKDELQFRLALSLGFHERQNAAIVAQSAGWILNGKGVAQQALAERAFLARDSASDPALADTVSKLLAKRSELAALTMAAPRPGQEAARRRQLDLLGQQEQELSRKLGQATGRKIDADPWVEPTDVRKSLAIDTLLIDIARFHVDTLTTNDVEPNWRPAHYVAWVIPAAGHGDITIVDLGDGDKIDGAVQEFRTAMADSATIIRADGRDKAEEEIQGKLGAVSKLILEPLLSRVKDAKELILSPDAALWLIPWAALPVDDGGKEVYAIEKWRIRYVTSGRDLVTPPSAVAGDKKPSAPRIFANPNYDLGVEEAVANTDRILRGQKGSLTSPFAPKPDAIASASPLNRSTSTIGHAGRLKGTAEEASAIAPHLQTYAKVAPISYLDNDALEGVFKQFHSPRVLVLSTHGFFLPKQEVKIDKSFGMARGLDGIVTGKKGQMFGTSATLDTEGQPLENPLLRCGLLLAGCNHRDEIQGNRVDDGVLTGMEIVGTDLRGTELVVLSACETGLGDVRSGEGVAGLRQAFQLAGAETVVSTLWRIPDQETTWLMTRFWENLAKGQNKADALRDAQLLILHHHAELTALSAKGQQSEIDSLLSQRGLDLEHPAPLPAGGQVSAKPANPSTASSGRAHPLFWAAFTITGE